MARMLKSLATGTEDGMVNNDFHVGFLSIIHGH